MTGSVYYSNCLIEALKSGGEIYLMFLPHPHFFWKAENGQYMHFSCGDEVSDINICRTLWFRGYKEELTERFVLKHKIIKVPLIGKIIEKIKTLSFK